MTTTCGNTVVTETEVVEARRLFEQQLPAATSGLSIAQRLAVSASAASSERARQSSAARPGFARDANASGARRRTDPSLRVVNSHLEYFRKFEPFRRGLFTKDTLYRFLFYVVVERRGRMSYAKRVLRSVLSYARRYLAENGGAGDRVALSIGNGTGPRSAFEVQLTPESVDFFREHPRGIVVQSKRFYTLMNSVGEQTNNQRLKNVVCAARRSRDLVFTERQNGALLAFVLAALRRTIEKHSPRHHATDGRVSPLRGWRLGTAVADEDDRVRHAVDGLVSRTRPSSGDEDRTVFEFCVAFLIGFLSGARVKSTVTRLTVSEMDHLVRGGTVEKLTKGSFARVFLPECLTRANGTDGPRGDGGRVARLLKEITAFRRDPTVYGARTGGDDVLEQPFFASGGRRLDRTFDRVFEALFAQRRPKGVSWHSQRRRYLGTVNERFGSATASKSVGHADVETTMLYINQSLHREDTNRRAGSAVYDEMVRLMKPDAAAATAVGPTRG